MENFFLKKMSCFSIKIIMIIMIIMADSGVGSQHLMVECRVAFLPGGELLTEEP